MCGYKRWMKRTRPSRMAPRTLSHEGRVAGLTCSRFSSSTRKARGRCRVSKAAANGWVDLNLFPNDGQVTHCIAAMDKHTRDKWTLLSPANPLSLFHRAWSRYSCLGCLTRAGTVGGRTEFYVISCPATTCLILNRPGTRDRSPVRGAIQETRIQA